MHFVCDSSTRSHQFCLDCLDEEDKDVPFFKEAAELHTGRARLWTKDAAGNDVVVDVPFFNVLTGGFHCGGYSPLATSRKTDNYSLATFDHMMNLIEKCRPHKITFENNVEWDRRTTFAVPVNDRMRCEMRLKRLGYVTEFAHCHPCQCAYVAVAWIDSSLLEGSFCL